MKAALAGARSSSGPGADPDAGAGSGCAARGPGALPGGCVQQIVPMGAGQESRWVLLAAVLVLLGAGLVVFWQHRIQPLHGLQSFQMDMAAELTAAEQGIYTDLQVVYEEWLAEGGRLPPPEPSWWADGGWAPFMDDAGARRRGARHWHRLELGGRHAYLGVPASTVQPAAQPAGEALRLMLWRLPEPAAGSGMAAEAAVGQAGVFDVWLREDEAAPFGEAPLSERLEDDALIAHGWRQVVGNSGRTSVGGLVGNR